MSSSLEKFEAIARALAQLQETQPTLPAPEAAPLHPFDSRNVHPDLPSKVRELFDDGHYPQATELAFKHLDKEMQRHSGLTTESGFKLMMAAFDGANPEVKLNSLVTVSEKDEQEGFRFVFAGGMRGIRNPRAHDPGILDDPDICLDHLSLVS